MASNTKYFQCLYCIPFIGGHGKKVPRTVGNYRVRQVGDTTLLFQCQKCIKTFKIRMIGVPLRWEDMADVEKIWVKEGEQDG